MTTKPSTRDFNTKFKLKTLKSVRELTSSYTDLCKNMSRADLIDLLVRKQMVIDRAMSVVENAFPTLPHIVELYKEEDIEKFIKGNLQ